MRWRVKGRLWVSREGGGERDSGDTIHSVEDNVGLSQVFVFVFVGLGTS